MAADHKGDSKFNGQFRNVVFVGKTGHGKTHLIQFLNGQKQLMPKQHLESLTDETTAISSSTLQVNFWDTPGLCDSQGRDQVFINQMIHALQRATRMHRVYFCLRVCEESASMDLQMAFATVGKLFDTNDGRVVRLVLTRCDKEENDFVESARARWKTFLARFIDNPVVLTASVANITELVADIQSIDSDHFIQTKFMKQVEVSNAQIELLRKQAQEAADEKEKMRLELQAKDQELEQMKNVAAEVTEQQQQYVARDGVFRRLGESLGAAVDFLGEKAFKHIGCVVM